MVMDNLPLGLGLGVITNTVFCNACDGDYHEPHSLDHIMNTAKWFTTKLITKTIARNR